MEKEIKILFKKIPFTQIWIASIDMIHKKTIQKYVWRMTLSVLAEL
jgi:hypothetical protein